MPKDNPIKQKKDTAFVGVDAADYTVPSFLKEKLDNVAATQDFNTVYVPGVEEEPPLWWSRNADLPLTKRDYKKMSKEMEQRNKELTEERIFLEKANKEFAATLARQEEEYKQKVALLDKEVGEKNRQYEEYKEALKLSYENRLLELETQLQEERRKADLLEKEEKKIELMAQIDRAGTSADEEVVQELRALEEDILSVRKANEEKKKALVAKYEEMGITYARQQKAPEPQVVPSRPLEQYDEKNILEIKSLNVVDKETGMAVLENVTFDVEKCKPTMVYAAADTSLDALSSFIMRNLPTHLQCAGGELRLDGENASEYTREEFKDKLNSTVVNVTYLADKFARTKKPLIKCFPLDSLSESFFSLLREFGLSPNVVNVRLCKLPQEAGLLLALAFGLSYPVPLVLINNMGNTPAGFDDMIRKVCNRPLNKAVLIFTSQKDDVLGMSNVDFYRISTAVATENTIE